MDITIYVPDDLASKLAILPKRSISKTCQAALREAVETVERERDDAISFAFEED